MTEIPKFWKTRWIIRIVWDFSIIRISCHLLISLSNNYIFQFGVFLPMHVQLLINISTHVNLLSNFHGCQIESTMLGINIFLYVTMFSCITLFRNNVVIPCLRSLTLLSLYCLSARIPNSHRRYFQIDLVTQHKFHHNLSDFSLIIH